VIDSFVILNILC